MGRRGAPQPLRLSDPTGATAATTTASIARDTNTTNLTLTSADTNANANHINATSPSSHHNLGSIINNSNDFNRPSPGRDTLNSSLSAPAPSSAAASPTDTRSPQSSPRVSPFTSRFNTRRPQTSTATSDDRSRPLHTDENTPPLPEARHDPSHPSISSTGDGAPLSTASKTAPPTHPPQGVSRLQKSHTEHSKKFSRTGFFHFAKSSKANNSLHSFGNTTSSSDSRNRSVSRGKDGPDRPADASDYPVQPVPSHPSASELSISTSGDRESGSAQSSARKQKPKPFGLLTRTKSIRDQQNTSPTHHAAPPLPSNPAPNEHLQSNGHAPMTAPPGAQDRSFRDMMNSAARNRSEDRAPSRDTNNAPREHHHREREHRAPPPATRENGGGSNFFSGLRSSSTKAADMISKGLFGKSASRHATVHHAEPVIDDEHYELRVINLPLVEQTRKTRISKRLETSRDKTEFWMPAFPWRAIDYLNYKGCEVEGLYRVPGSGPQIKRWQRKFDEHYDVNLFEAEDLYDINIIGSMLKAWLRELPDELFPKAAQERISRECAGAEEVPQMLIDELSNLSPFNYYLLFAITCHLSLLLAHSDKNKMDFRNLCICFQPCMKIDAFCFRFLVCDWRECWKGCLNESRYIEEEYKLFDQPPPKGLTEPQGPSTTGLDDRTPTGSSMVPEVEVDDEFHESREMPDTYRDRQMSSSSSKQSYQDAPDAAPNSKMPKRKLLPLSTSKGSTASNNSAVSSSLTTGSEQRENNGREQREDSRGTSDMRPLSPIKPLSPIGF